MVVSCERGVDSGSMLGGFWVESGWILSGIRERQNEPLRGGTHDGGFVRFRVRGVIVLSQDGGFV